MKLLKKKKGFTIVELVIVIAVIAVLAAVLIPTFINLTSKANKASDESLVNSLNKALAIEEVDHDINNMHDAVECLNNEGYNASILVAKSDQKLLYNVEKNRFLLEEDKESDYNGVPDYEFWTVANSYDPANQQYSIYAGKDFATENIADLEVGFDAGDSTNISSISFVGNGEANQKAIIRSNGGAVEINAPSAKVYHYGKVDALDIKAVAPTSYHERGEVGYAKLYNGRFVVEETAKVDGLYLVANNLGEFDGIKIAVVGNAKLPELARAEVDLDDGDSKLVVEIQTLANSEAVDENPEYVWISKSGTEVSSKVSTSNNKADYASHVVENPTPAAAATKEKAKDSAAPITTDSEARINAVGYATLGQAFAAANDGDTVCLLKDITVDVSNPDDFGFYKLVSDKTYYYGIFYYLEKACNIDGRNHKITTANATRLPNNNVNTGFIYYDYRAQNVSIKDLIVESEGFNYVVTYGGVENGVMDNCKITSDNCCVTISCFASSDPRGGVLNITNSEFNFIKGNLTRSDYAPSAAPVASQYGSDIIMKNCDISATDGGALYVWPSGGTITANNCNIVCSENVAYSWIGNGSSNTKTDSTININNSNITGSSSYNVKASTGSSNSGQHHTASIYVDGVLKATVTEE